MSKAFTAALAALAACALFGCSGGGLVTDGSTEPSTETDGTEPALFSGETESANGPRNPDQRDELALANGAIARSISYNHPEPHALTIPALDLSSGRNGVYQLSLGGGAHGELHTHDVTLSAHELSIIRDGAEVTIESGAGGMHAHTHSVTIGRR
jgi:hypothetical protein